MERLYIFKFRMLSNSLFLKTFYLIFTLFTLNRKKKLLKFFNHLLILNGVYNLFMSFNLKLQV